MKYLGSVLTAGMLVLASCTREEPKPQSPPVIAQTGRATGAVLVAESKEKLTAAKKQLEAEGKYDCCMEDACDHCALNEGSCTCAPDVKKDGHVCNECYAGWQQGRGDVPNIKPEHVTTTYVKQDK